MKLLDYLPKDLIIPSLRAKDKRGVLDELSEACAAYSPEINRNKLLEVLIEREQLGSTGIGDHVALPHGKLPKLSRMLVAFARSEDGVPFESKDSRPAKLFFLLVAPEDSSGTHLKALARISRMCKERNFCERLESAVGKDEIYQVITSEDNKD
ncbi:MAG: PTS sugar transporter subunit IIA [Deltaproteobacteria bacterium]|nr:PTS sugar transporter subunit IIA [Deltaproteobacteria bacterium]